MEAALTQFRAETHDHLVDRARMTLWLALAALATFALMDLVLNPAVVAYLYACKGVAAIGPASCIVLLRTDWGRRWVNGLVLVSVAAIIGGVAAQSGVIDRTLLSETAICIAFVVATLIPWRVVHQATCVVVVCTGVALDTFRGFGSVDELGGAIIFASLSIYVTYVFEQQRFALWRSDRDFRGAKDRAERQEEKYRDLVENLAEVVYTLDEDGRITYLSPTFEALSGYTQDEAMGRKAIDLAHPDDATRLAENIQRELAGHPAPIEVRFITKSGNTIWVRTTSRLIEDKGRRQLSGTLADITERKQAEAELKESSERFQQLADNVEDIFWIWTSDYRLIYLSPAFEKVTGLSRREAMRSLETVLEVVHRTTEKPSPQPWSASAADKSQSRRVVSNARTDRVAGSGDGRSRSGTRRATSTAWSASGATSPSAREPRRRCREARSCSGRWPTTSMRSFCSRTRI